MVAGCNVENVSYGLGLCAECAVVCALYSGGGGRLIALSCVAADGESLMPCGRCRQVLLEHGGPQMLIDHPLGRGRWVTSCPTRSAPTIWPAASRSRTGNQP